MLTLHELTLTNVAGVPRATAEFPPTGVTVIHGPNEAGKSTLLEAFLLLIDPDTKHASTKKEVRKIRPIGVDAAPSVSARMTLGDHLVEYRKTFSRGGEGKTVLRILEPTVRSLTGDEAHAAFRELLREKVDVALLRALFIGQGESLDSVAMGEVQTLARVLSGASGNTSDAAGSTATGSDAASIHGPSSSLTGGSPSTGAPIAAGWEDAGSTEILGLARKEYQRYYTPKGDVAKGKELDHARMLHDEAVDTLAEHTAAYDRVSGILSRIQSLMGETAKLRRQLPAAQRDLLLAQDVAEHARAHVEKLEKLRQDVRSAVAPSELAAKLWEERQEHIDRVRRARTAAQLAASAAAEAESAAATEALAVEQLSQRSDAARCELAAAKAGAVALDAAVALQRENVRAAEALSILHRAEGHGRTIGELEATLRDNRATPDAMRELRTATSALRQAEAVLEVHRVTARITGPDGADFLDNGTRRTLPDDGATIPISGPHTFGLGQYTLAVTPGIGAKEAAAAVEVARRTVEDQLRRIGVEQGPAGSDSAAALDGMLRECEKLAATRDVQETQLTSARAELQAVVSAQSGGPESPRRGAERGVEGGMETLRAQVDEARRRVRDAEEALRMARGQWEHAAGEAERSAQRVPQPGATPAQDSGEVGAAAPPAGAGEVAEDGTGEGLSAGLDGVSGDGAGGVVLGALAPVVLGSENLDSDELSRLVLRATEYVAECEAAVEDLRRREKAVAVGALHRLGPAQEHARSTTEEATRAEAHLAARRDHATDQQLESEAAAARERLEALSQQLEQQELETRDSGVDPVMAEAQFAGARQRVQSLENDLRAKSSELRTQQVLLAESDGSGIAEKKAEAEGAVTQTAAALERVEVRAGAARLLKDTLERARADARRRYEAPFLQALEGLARRVFGPQVTFEVDDNLAVTTRSEGGTTVEAGSLSGGAKEQVQLLVRLATASLVGRGEGVPIFVDDALGFSDDERLGRLNAVLSLVGEDHQIIVLTCDPNRFNRIAGAQLHSMEALRSAEVPAP